MKIIKRMLLVFSIVLVPVVVLILFYQIKGNIYINQELSRGKELIPIAREYFINTKDKLLLLRMGEFADIGLNCYYNHELKDMCVSFIKEHEDANKSIYTLEDPKLREILPQEEIDGLIYLTTPSENGCSYSSICISMETDYFGANISTDESSFWVDDRYTPMARQGNYYIEKLDDEYYIQIAVT